MVFFIQKQNTTLRVFLILIGACVAISATAQPAVPPSTPIGSKKEFWVWDLSVMPPGFRKTTATLKTNGARSLIYAEDNMEIPQSYITSLNINLEIQSPEDAAFPRLGIVPMEERVFSPLPKKINPDDRVIILFANLGKYKEHEFDGFFNAYDQMTESEAQKENQHSNEANIIYLNGMRKTADYTTGVIAHELQHLLAHNATGKPDFSQDLWLSETLAEGAMLLAGYFTDQGHLHDYALTTGKYPLVSHTYVQYGSQLMFASYLLDSIKDGWSALGFLTKLNGKGRDAIETLFRQKSNTPLSFDAIYGNFISYIFENAATSTKLPYSWNRPSGSGLLVPAIRPYASIQSFPAQVEGSLYPYSFVAIDMAIPLPVTSIVKVEVIPHTNSITDETSQNNCGSSANVLWKPITVKKIAIYAVGCEHQGKDDYVNFRLKILDRPLLLPESPLKIGL